MIFREPKNNNEIFGFPCDHCQPVTCKPCSGISTTEVRSIILQKRIGQYLCPGCLTNVRQILGVVSRVDKLENELSSLKQEVTKLTSITDEIRELRECISSLEKTTQSLESQIGNSNRSPTQLSGPLNSLQVPDQNELWQELHDRQSRSNNIMIFNLPENENDVNDVSSIIDILCDNPPKVVNSSRVGKKNSKGARAIRVCLPSHEDALMLIRNRRKLKNKNVFISFDLTRQQQEIDKKIWSEFKTRVAKGEKNIQVKFSKGVPCTTNSGN